MKADPNVLAHQEWIGFVQPAGLVVSATALVRAGAILPRRDTEGQRLLAGCVTDTPVAPGQEPTPALPDFEAFARGALGWSFSPKGFAGGPASEIPEELVVALPELGITLAPDLAVREREPADDGPPWQLLVQVMTDERPFDGRGEGRDLSPHIAMERLLRETGVAAGLIAGPRALRLISAPRGESSGWLDFQVAEMVTLAGRPICAAMRLLLSQPRLLTLPKAQRLAALLADSRRFQNEVSEKLAEQVLHALYELLRGFQAAHEESHGQLLARELRESPDDVYRGLLTVILRLVFLLYAEERDMLPGGETFVRYYSLAGLFERLRANAAQYPDTMDLRYGAWPQLLSLFRVVYHGAPALAMPPRHGTLFEPDRFPFLEGRIAADGRPTPERIEPPRVADGTVYRALEKLLVLNGERISYRALDVEQIGSVYETMMGFRLELATGRSIAIKAHSRHGAPTTVDLEALLSVVGDKRAKWLQDHVDRKLTPTVAAAVKTAATVDDVHAALAPVIDAAATPDLVPAAAMVLQPSPERRRTGSHYTPRSLTEPIVRTTLEPILDRLRGPDGLPAQADVLLDLKVCDPAMGSAAFLVEACRHLGDELVRAWAVHGGRPEIPPDEDEVTFARRLIAQRCLYGVDRNPVAVDIAKMSLWLVTLAREHPLTFLDHALRHGDSLVGLTQRQIETFHWSAADPNFAAIRIDRHIGRVAALRRQIREADDGTSDRTLRDTWEDAQQELDQVRLFGDLAIAAFFDGANPRARDSKRLELADAVTNGTADRYRDWLQDLRGLDSPLVPFHWQVEFPEVFDGQRRGFDAVIGNPPFLGGTRISSVHGMEYFQWLKQRYPPAGHLCDIVAYFFRAAYALLRPSGTLGFVATNTVAQGDTRSGGLAHLCVQEGATIYSATRRYKWPGSVSVVVSVVHLIKGAYDGTCHLDGDPVGQISAFLFHAGGHQDPVRLSGRNELFSAGSKIYGQGFVFDDSDDDASPMSDMQAILEAEPPAQSRIHPYLGGNELNQSPTQKPSRFVIDLNDIRSEDGLAECPLLAELVRRKVKPGRDLLGSNPNNVPLKRRWWAYQAHRPNLYAGASALDRVLVCSQVTPHVAFAFEPSNFIFSHKLIVFLLPTFAQFAVLQSRVHEIWVRFFTSTSMDLLSYSPSDCFETFPIPPAWDQDPRLEAAGCSYYEFRADLMIRNEEGLTTTYNRFHDPYEHDLDIERLRELHTEMDRAVLHAYGWDDINTDVECLLDYEIDEEDWGKKKKPYRLRWPDAVRDDVLARLIALNGERAAEEARSGAAAQVAKTPRRRAPRKQAAAGAHELG